MSEALLALEHVEVSFDGFKAIDDLSFSLPRGALRVLIGPNGAGKSTLLDTVIGKVAPRSGRVLYRGRDLRRLSEHEVAGLGICRKFQTPGVLGNLSVRGNISVSARRRKQWWRNLTPRLTGAEERRVDEVLALVDLAGQAHLPAGQLAHGQKQWLEIGMVVAAEPELLLLDEPTAGMTARETAKTAELILRLAGRHTILVIDHDMHFVELLGAPISVLHGGRVFKEGSLQELRGDPEVIEIYLGRAREDGHAQA